MHGHARLSFHHKSTRRQSRSSSETIPREKKAKGPLRNHSDLLSASQHSELAKMLSHDLNLNICSESDTDKRDADNSSAVLVKWNLLILFTIKLFKGKMNTNRVHSNTKRLSGQIQIQSEDASHAVPLHEVSEQVHDLLLQSGPVLNDGISFVGHFLLKLLQLLDLLTNLELGLGQGCDPGYTIKPSSTQTICGQTS